MQQMEPPPFLVPASELNQIRKLTVLKPWRQLMGDTNFYVRKDADVLLSTTEWKRLEKEELSKCETGKTKKVGI